MEIRAIFDAIVLAFEDHQHLRMAVGALALANDHEGIRRGEIRAFETWCHCHPRVRHELGGCRLLLTACCPILFNHAQASHNPAHVESFFAESARQLVAAEKRLEERRQTQLYLDFSEEMRLPGSKSIPKRCADAQQAAGLVLTLIAKEKGLDVVPQPVPGARVLGVLVRMCKTKSYLIHATPDMESQLAAEALAMRLLESNRTVEAQEDVEKFVHILHQETPKICVSFPLVNGQSEKDFLEEVEEVAKELF